MSGHGFEPPGSSAWPPPDPGGAFASSGPGPKSELAPNVIPSAAHHPFSMATRGEPWSQAFPWSMPRDSTHSQGTTRFERDSFPPSPWAPSPAPTSSSSSSSNSTGLDRTGIPFGLSSATATSSARLFEADLLAERPEVDANRSRLANLAVGSPSSVRSPSTASSSRSSFAFDPWGSISSDITRPSSVATSISPSSSDLNSGRFIRPTLSSGPPSTTNSILPPPPLFASHDFARQFAPPRNSNLITALSSAPHPPIYQVYANPPSSPIGQESFLTPNLGPTGRDASQRAATLPWTSASPGPTRSASQSSRGLLLAPSRPSPPLSTTWSAVGGGDPRRGSVSRDPAPFPALPPSHGLPAPAEHSSHSRYRGSATPSPPLSTATTSYVSPGAGAPPTGNLGFAHSSAGRSRSSPIDRRASASRTSAGRIPTASPSIVIPVPPTVASLTRSTETKLRSGLPDRSTWAMWCGNIPSDATENELWSFFLQRAPLLASGDGDERSGEGVTGVDSIHLIARSNCAFVNYVSEAHLQQAITQSNGVSLRPNDRRCKPLVCRLRMREDDAKSGVGAQRGAGMHKAYVAVQKGSDLTRRSKTPPRPPFCGDELGGSSGDGSPSTSSTSSSFYQDHFPKRFFVLKAKEIEDLERSIRTGFWSTQGHNEDVLDQAYRTSLDGVYLFFSANRSGGFAGYARMAGPIFSTAKTKSDRSPARTASFSAETAEFIVVADSTPSPTSPPDAAAVLEGGGTPFPVKWLSTRTVPFRRTQAILNSFNLNRPVKISRDGTEVEPLAGEQLIREFDALWGGVTAGGGGLGSGATGSPRGTSPIPPASGSGSTQSNGSPPAVRGSSGGPWRTNG